MALSGLCLPKAVFLRDTIFGLTSQITYDHGDTVLKTAVFLNSAALLVLAAKLLFSPRALRLGLSFSHFRLFVLGYTLITAVFHGLRVIFDANRLLLVGAALHNLFEWGMIGAYSQKQENVSKFFNFATLWIWLVITLSALAPTWTLAVFAEQQTGIVCDYILLFLTSLRLFILKKDDPAPLKTILTYSAWAAFLHFGQIWTLVLIIFGVRSHLVEGLVVFTAPITFYLYGEAALLWEEEYNRFMRVDDNATPPQESPQVSHKGDYYQSKKDTFNPYLSKELTSVVFVKAIFPILLIVILILSFLTISGPAVFFSECPDPSLHPIPSSSTNAYCQDNGPVLGFTTLKATPGQEDALEQWIEQMIKPSRAEPGNQFYYFLKGNNPGEYAFVEKWASEEIKNKHLASEAVTKIFRSPHFVGMATELKLFGPWHPIEPCTLPPAQLPPLELAWTYELRSPLAMYWRNISNFADVSWVIGSSGAVVYGDLRNISMHDGTWVEVKLVHLNHVNHTFTYEITDYKPKSMIVKVGYRGTVHLVPSPKDPERVTIVSYVNSFYPVDGMDRDFVRTAMIENFAMRHETIKAKFAYPSINQSCKEGVCA